jgi:poly(hydroxyalkanoate) depolymerase family esterase
MDTHNRMSSVMAEATRLTRAGRLLEATAIIQDTLRGLPPKEASSNATTCTDDESIDVSFRVVDETPSPTEVTPSGRDYPTPFSAVTAPPPPEAAMPPPSPGSASAESTKPHEEGHSGVSSPIHDRRQNEHREPMPVQHKWTARVRAMLRSHQSGRARPVSDRARRDIWAGGQYTDGSYTNHAGTRNYKLYVPSGYTGQALPLVVMLHGCTQTPDDFAAGTRMNVLAERELFFVAYPQQAPSANQLKCWNWFQTTDQQRGHGEPSIIAGLTQEIVRNYHLDTRRVYVVGLSAGGAMAAILGITYPDLYAAVGVHSGLAYGTAYDLPSAHAAMQHGSSTATRRFAGTRRGPRVARAIVFHGDQDTTVHPCNGDQIVAQWRALHSEADKPETVRGAGLWVSVSSGQVADGHAYTCSSYHDTNGRVVMEKWRVHGAGHGWSGGSAYGSFTDPKGPNASQEMLRFFSCTPI